ncbi:ribonuclease H-like domain-containing protein [Tanacetum coccineum]
MNLHQHLSRISTQKLETASQITRDVVTTHLKMASQDLQTASECRFDVFFRDQLLVFQQHQDESLYDLWTHFKDVILKVLNYGLSIWHLIKIFLKHLDSLSCHIINLTAEGDQRKFSDIGAWEVPIFDQPEPQPLLNSPSLDVSLGDVIGPEPPIKPHSPDSSRMKVIDSLTTQTPPSPHVVNSHPKGVYGYYNPGVDISNWEMFDDDWGLESKEVSPLGEELSLFDKPNEVERGRILEAHRLESILQQQISQHMAPSHHDGKKAHLLEDKRIPSVGVFNIWKAFGGNTRDLGSFKEEINKITDLHQHLSRISTQKLETASQITRDAVMTHTKTASQDLKTASLPNTPINSEHGDDFIQDPDPVTRISKLDISDPLHLHPNDTTALTVISIKLKGTENYQVWSCAMLLALEGKNKTGFIDGTCKRSNINEILGKQWDKVNAIVLGWILNSIFEELFLGQFFSKRAKHVWEELKETYDKVDGSIMFGLHHQISTLKQNGSSIADYYYKLNALWKQYDAMIELPKCVCNASESFKKHNQLLKLIQFLMGLDDSYMQIRSSVLSREVLPDVRSAYATISSEISYRVTAGSIAGSSQRNQASAFVSGFSQSLNNGPRLNNMNNNRQSGGSGLVCENRGFNGHTIDRCFKIIGYLGDFGKKKFNQSFKRKNVSNNNSIGTSSSFGFTDEQMATPISLIKDNKVGKRANQHMTYTDKELDNVIDISHLRIKLGHPNRTEAYISKIGNLILSNGLTLYDVMVIPEYCVTLIYVHKLAKENKVIVAFDENRCYFLNQDLSLKNVLGIGDQCEGLYYYNNQEPVLDVLKDSLLIDKKDNVVCSEICQRAKQTREPFPLSDHTSKCLGDLVHLDLWGP